MESLLKRIRFVHIISLLGLLMIFIFFYLYAFAMNAAQRQDSKEINIAMITALATILGYWVGSSAGSARKDATINSMSGQQQPQAIIENAQDVNVSAQDKQGESQIGFRTNSMRGGE